MRPRALVTGAAGFLGRHFASALQARGYSVDRCDINYTGYRAGSARDALDVFARSEGTRFDLVVHCAAVSPHRLAIDSMAGHLAENLRLDAEMFAWAIRTGQPRVLYPSSCAVYPASLQDVHEPLSEDAVDLDRPEPCDDYAWIKLTGERLARKARTAGVAVTVVRPFSGYGECQSEDFPFRAITERVRRHENPIDVWGNGFQVRDWVHVDDVVGGALAVVDSGTAEPVNLCTGIGTTMRELAGTARRQIGHTGVIRARNDKPGGAAYRVGNPARLHRYYRPTVSLAEGVRRTLGDSRDGLRDAC